MIQNQKKTSVCNYILAVLILLTAVLLKYAFIADERWYKGLFITIPAIVILSIYSVYRTSKFKIIIH